MKAKWLKPMAAKPYRADRTTFPALVQPKFNGIRIEWDGVEAYTRTPRAAKPHVQTMLHAFVPKLPEGWVLDGELLLPRGFSFQQTESAVKKENEHSPLLYYAIYDVDMRDNPEVPFWSRWDNLNCWYPGLSVELRKHMILSTCFTVNHAESVDHWLNTWIGSGYEGAIVRERNAVYRHGSSGRALQKYKKHLDAEFEIVGVKEATGKDAGTAVFICKMPNSDETFDVRPMGTFARRKDYWDNRADLIGKPLTVKYWDTFDSGVPQFGQGIAVRDYE